MHGWIAAVLNLLGMGGGGSPPPPSGDGVPGGAFRRPPWSWGRVFAPEPSTWSRCLKRTRWERVWRYDPVANERPVTTHVGVVGEDRDFAFDFSRAPELKAGSGLTISSAVIIPDPDLTIGTPAVLDAAFDGIPIGKGVSVRLSGFEDDAEYKFACRITLSNGRKLSVPGRIVGVAAAEGAPLEFLGATIDATGLVLTLEFSEAVTGANADGFTLSATGGPLIATYTSGDGTNTLVFALSRVVTSDETATIDYTPGTVEDLAGNPLVAFSGAAVVNNSAVPPPEPAAILASDGAWTWFNAPVAIYDAANDLTIVGAIGATGAVRVHKFRHSTGRLQSSSIATGFQIDDHNNPAVIRLADDTPNNPGQFLFAYSQHNGSQHSRTGRALDSIVALNTAVNTTGVNWAYIEFVQVLDDARTIYRFHRMTANTVPVTPWGRAFVTSTDGGNTWSAETQFFQGESNFDRPYPQFARHPSQLRHDVLIGDGHPTDIRNRIHHCYFTVAANGARTWFKSDGTQIGTGDSELPLLAADCTTVLDDANVNAWLWDAAWVEGVLTCAYAHPTAAALLTWASTHTYKIARLVNGVWEHETVCDAGGTGADGLIAGQPAYSGGICLDRNDRNVCLVARKYGEGDVRIEKMLRHAVTGLWTKVADVSGDTGTVNARPRFVEGSNPSQFVYWSGTYDDYTDFATDVWVYPGLEVEPLGQEEKPTAPAWQAGHALTAGVNHYYPLHEGAGTTLTDLVPSGGQNGAFVGTPTWSVGPLGPQLGGFTTANYVAIDPATQPIATGSYPWFIEVTVAGTNTTANQWPLMLGRSTSGNPIVGFRLNAALGRVEAFVRDDASVNVSITVDGTAINDGQPHTLLLVAWGANSRELYIDGQLAGSNAVTLGAVTLNRMTVGAQRSTGAASQPYLGDVIRVVTGEADVADPYDQADDGRGGTFAAVRPPA